MSNSPLVNYTQLSPNNSGARTHSIDTITIHCVVGQCSVETLGKIFAPSSRQASSNYGVGYDGRIGMYVEEGNRSWCSSSNANDQRAVTIEVASDTTEPYAVNGAAYNATIKLVADICRRNGIAKLIWSDSRDDRVNHRNGCNMTVHRDYANKSCPGTFLYSHMRDIAQKVNDILAADDALQESAPPQRGITAGSLVRITGTRYYSGIAIPKWVRAKNWYVEQVIGDRVIINKSEDGNNSINSPVKLGDLALVEGPQVKSVDELAREVINGKWGNGAERKSKLGAAGYDYAAVQRRVNEMLK